MTASLSAACSTPDQRLDRARTSTTRLSLASCHSHVQKRHPCRHSLLRTTAPDLSDLRDTVRLATAAGAEAIAVSGRQRACELLHLPHLMEYVAALLRRYAARFEGAHSARLHHAVRRLREANGTRARVLQPEALAAELGMPTRCVDMWWRDPRCEAEGAHAEIRPSP